ncbi:response regulator transcription factor [Paenibacillus sp. HWE-109]|uniref:response regulator transcription factor n=1 Tax=Paenibacillus sp. HWE-109 TaxID=1306526 RepID=UPI001EDF860D|nr:response regulator transcription factor [Paenibacillus sp. HWE-109]UKS26558.1 response regulator transcription factor [Paenibacillus sp. HWE-109]
MNKITILVVDDDSEIRDFIHIFLCNEGYHVLEAENGLKALEIVQTTPVQLIILDVMMPHLDGIRACLKIRETSKIPIIMLSAKEEEMDKITGLTTGADDYVTKPFSLLELVARVKAQLRRQSYSAKDHEDDVISVGDLIIDKARHQVTVKGKEVSLTPLEFSILELMASHRGYVFSVDQIYERVWKETSSVSDNTVVVHVRNLREKIEENPREPRYVKTVWGVGYKIEK